MVNTSSEVTLVAGPPHTVRWSWHVRDGVVDSPLAWDRFIGQGGAPMWNESLLRRAAAGAGSEARVAVLVGDFRFGNGILLEEPVPSEVLADGFTGITARALTPEGDRAMLERGLDGMRAWHETFGARARYVLWDVFGRQVQDRLAGRHISEGRYRHPMFNYDEIVAALPDLDIIDLAPLLRLPQHDVLRLFIDSSNHPSQIGYMLLNGLIFDRLDVQEAYDRAVATVEEDLFGFAQKVSESAGRPVLLTGRSVWLDTLSWYMGANGTQRLADAGIILAPLDHAPGQPSLTQIVERTDLASCAVVVVSAGGKDLSTMLSRAFPTSNWTDVPVIDWESATEKAIGDRGETPRFTHVDRTLRADPDAIKPILVAPAVEQGPYGTPSWSGIKALLHRIAKISWQAPITGAREEALTAVTPNPQGAKTGHGVREMMADVERGTSIDRTSVCAGAVEHPVRMQAGAELHAGSSLGRFGFLNVGTIVYGGVEIGRYFSCGRGAEIGVAPHPLSGLSTHGFTVNAAWFPRIEGYGHAGSGAPSIPAKPTTRIGHDVWIGAQAVVMPGVRIHTGAVIAANAVVTRDVEPYEIVGGVPAKHIKFRFSEDIRRRLLASEWWKLNHDVIQELPYRDIAQSLAVLDAMTATRLKCDSKA